MRRIITLITDFGTADGYVAELKGVLLSGAPDVTVVDLTHDIPPQDVEAGRLTLARSWRRFPEGTVHLVIVDPGVGSPRAALAVHSHGRFLIGPDNGVLSPALLAGAADVIALPIPPHASATFHGRDVFAPAAVRLAAGESLDRLGVPMTDPVIRRTPDTRRREDGSIAGQVMIVDRFGNLVTNIVARLSGYIDIAGQSVAVARTYADVAEGDLVALAGSSGFLEVAVRGGSAAAALSARRGDAVAWRAE